MTQIPEKSTRFSVTALRYWVSMVISKFIAWLIAHKMVPLPTAQCREAIITGAVKASVNGISNCAPVDSNIQVTFTACSPAQEIWLAFFNQIKVAFCYIFGQITDILASLTTIETNITTLQGQMTTVQGDIVSIEAEIAAIPIMRTPGTVNITVGGAAGAGSAASISGNDTAGKITLTTGTGVGTGIFFTLGFPTPYTTAGILHLEPGNKFSEGVLPTLPTTDTSVSGSVGRGDSAFSDGTIFVWNYVVLGGT